MQAAPTPVLGSVELDAAILQGAVTFGLCIYTLSLYRRYRKPFFGWLATAWFLYVLRLLAIATFLVSGEIYWLYAHQVITGWTALALLWAALVFLRQPRFRAGYLLALGFPLAWSLVAVAWLDRFILAALPAVVFLAAVTAGTGLVFLAHWKRVRSQGALFLAISLLLWALHHLDYPFLRARGAWVPWGYYLDTLFILAIAGGITTLVLDDLGRGFRALTDLASSARSNPKGLVEELLERAAGLPAARGAAMYRGSAQGPRFVAGVGECASWEGKDLGHAAAARLERAMAAGEPEILHDWLTPDGVRRAFAAVLPIPSQVTQPHALVVTGDARDPFAALDRSFLVALGSQLGAALDSAALNSKLQQRSNELARLSTRMVHQHEEERRRLSRELHDETAQVFSALKLHLGLVRERADSAAAPDLDRALELLDHGLQGIRSVTETLRPAVLDELGLAAALRSLVQDFSSRSGIPVEATIADCDRSLAPDVELVLYRALQESLANVLRHANATQVRVQLALEGSTISLLVEDNGGGIPEAASLERFQREGRMGLAGMRDRVAALAGALELGRSSMGGTSILVRLPLEPEGA
jgi:signal transduction histidine kinase